MSEAAPSKSSRILSIDAYRGFVMFLMLAEVLQLRRVANALKDSAFWDFLAYHQTHVEWVGCSLHDMIQPSFSFLVGVSLPFSIASRRAKDQSVGRMAWHAITRSIVLVLLGVFLRSVGKPQTYWTFEDTLSQIGLGYVFLFLLGLRPTRDVLIAIGLILVGYWAAFALYPLPAGDYDWKAAGVASPLTGFAAHWNKNTNPAWAADVWFLNLFSREKPFTANGGGYSTISFIPTLATMLLGLLAGRILHGDLPPRDEANLDEQDQPRVGRNLYWLIVLGVISLAAGWGLGAAGICPVVKKIWTPSWVLYSGGICFLMLAGFHAIMEGIGFWRWAYPLMVIGSNSIAAYCMEHLFGGFIRSALVRHLGNAPFQVLGPAYEPLLQGGAVMLVLWIILFWMNRNRIFIRV